MPRLPRLCVAAAAGDAGAYARGEFEDIPHTAMRRVIAQRLTEAKRSVPHYYLSADVSVDALLKLRAQVRCWKARVSGPSAPSG